jgi:hypothetical protein
MHQRLFALCSPCSGAHIYRCANPIFRRVDMRRLIYFLLLISAFGQAQGPPTVRDTYVLAGKPRVVSLKDNLIVVVCKPEYDAWLKDQKPPALSLYMNGLLMKGPEAARPMPGTDEQVKQVRDAVKADCAKESDDAFSTAKKDAEEKAAAAKTAADKAVSEPDATKKAALKEASDKADMTAKEAATKAASVKAGAQQKYVTMLYHLDSQYVTKPETKEPWIRLLERPWQSGGDVTISVGPADGSPWPSTAAIPFERINLGWLAGWAALFLIAIILFVKYARRSDIIRDPGELPAPPPGIPPQMKAYSLARTQMAFWTFLVSGALAFLFLVTWNENTISSGVLVLIGISFGTTLMAATADRVAPTATDVTVAEKDAADKSAAAREAADKAAAETDATKKPAADKEAADKAFAAKYAADKAASLKAGISQIPQPTKGFLADLLTEGTGPSFHRYQMVLFTVILAVIFVAKTASTLVMPEFDTTLLGLMGISSGTYLGFKLQGK